MNELSTIPPIWEEVKKYFVSHGIVPDLEVGLLTQWRIKAKLAIRGTYQKPLIGLFLPGTHSVQPIPNCPDHHPSINHVVTAVERAIVQEKISIYNETSKAGLLRYMQCLGDLSANRVQLVLVATAEDPALSRLIQRLLEREELWHSIWINVQPAITNQIFGEKWSLKFGDPFLFQKINDRSFAFHPAAFSQAHWTLFEKLASHVVQQVPTDSNLLEIYAGVGVMGSLASSRCKTVRLVENNPFSYESFRATQHDSNVHYHLGDAKEAIRLLPESGCILLDPPRKGLDASLLKALQASCGKIVYVSCDFSTFSRDADALFEAGWDLERAKGYLMFPGTNHVEIVATLKKPSV